MRWWRRWGEGWSGFEDGWIGGVRLAFSGTETHNFPWFEIDPEVGDNSEPTEG